MTGFVFPVISAGAVGTVTTYLFQRPELNHAGIKLLGKGALHGVASAVAAFALTIFSLKQLELESSDTATLTTYTVFSLLAAAGSKLILDRLGNSISYSEAFTTTLTANAVACWIVN